MRKPLFRWLALACAFLCVDAHATSTVTGNVFTASAVATTNSKITFTPRSTPVIISNTLYISRTVTLNCTNGTFSTPLVVGAYTLRIDDATRDTATIYVPNDDLTYDFNDLTTNAINFASTNAFAFILRTNGAAMGLVSTNMAIGSSNTPSPSAGQVLTYVAGGAASWSNAASGGSSAWSVKTNTAVVATNPPAIIFTNSSSVTVSGMSNAAGAVISMTATLTNLAPIGSITAWLKNYANTPALPSGWVEMNGQTLSDSGSPYNGQTIPDLNGPQYFLRGNTSSGATGGTDQHEHFVSLITQLSDPGGGSAGTYAFTTTPGQTDTTTGVVPPYYAVVWIMRVR